MKKNIPALAFMLFIAMVIFSCSSPETKLVGVWIVSDVEIDADTAKFGKEKIEQAVKMQKSVNFEIFEDKSMNIISGDGTYPGKWSFNKESDEIFVRLDGTPLSDSIKIGKLSKGKIINKEKADAGWVTVTYVKE